MSITIRQLPLHEILALTPATLSLAPIFDNLPAYASPHGAIFLAESGTTPVGLAALLLDGDTLHIRQFAISPRHHGQGIGSQLMAALLAQARTRHAARIRAQIPSWCPDWRGFYSRFNFTFPPATAAETDSGLATVELILPGRAGIA